MAVGEWVGLPSRLSLTNPSLRLLFPRSPIEESQIDHFRTTFRNTHIPLRACWKLETKDFKVLTRDTFDWKPCRL